MVSFLSAVTLPILLTFGMGEDWDLWLRSNHSV